MQLSEALGRFVGYLEVGDRRGAISYANDLLDGGLSAGELVLDVLVPAQATVGLNWARGAWSVEMEHIATDITEAVLAVAGARADPLPDRGRLVVVCAETERHSLPARMIAELLRFEGFGVVFLGSPPRAEGLTSFLAKSVPDAVIVSCSVAMNLPSVVPMILGARDAGVPALCGGHAFGADGSRASALGGCGWAPDLATAVEMIERWRSQPPEFAPTRTLGAAAADSLERARWTLVNQRLATHPGAHTPHSTADAEWWRDEFDAILRFLTATILLDDQSILTDFAAWLRERSAAGTQTYPDINALFRTVGDMLAADHPAASSLLSAQIEATLAAPPAALLP